MIIVLKTKEGFSIPIEVSEDVKIKEGLRDAGLLEHAKKIVEKNFVTLHDQLIALSKELKEISSKIDTDSFTVEIGLNFSQELGFIISNSSIGVELKVSMQWKRT